MNLPKNLKAKIRHNVALAGQTTFKIGGPAEIFIEPDSAQDLRRLLKGLGRNKPPLFIIGRGSNLLVNDKGLKGIVVRLNTPSFKKLSLKDGMVSAGCGVELGRLVNFAASRCLSGAEFLAGIPGSVGGALAMNAGISEKARNSKPITQSIGDLVDRVTVMDYEGNVKSINKKNIKSGYRRSGLAEYIILNALLKLKKEKKEDISRNIRRYLERRRSAQGTPKLSAGCIFKNPEGDSAGRLIDLCGLKGKKAGGARVSLKHANFILNTGQAKGQDVLKLMGLIRERVKAKFNITLEPEIKIWD